MKFALILAGCGQHDGSETHEVILTLLSLAQLGIAWDAFAPEMTQRHVTNHLTDKIAEGEQRNVLQESARLVRGQIKPLSKASVEDYDAIIFPGGVGAVTNLCDWYHQGNEFSFQSEVKQLIDAAVANKKPMGFICIAPMMIPKIFQGAQLTIGNDQQLSQQIAALGSSHVECQATDVVVDKLNRVVSTPANMVAQNIDEVYQGIQKLVRELVAMSA